MVQMIPIPANSLLTITVGAFSDFNISGVFRALADIDGDQLYTKFREEYPEIEWPSEGHFIAWLTRNKIIEPVDCFEWHLSDYSFSNTADMTIEKMQPDV